MRKLLSSLSIALLWATFAFAQERTVTGTVTAREDGLTLPGVSIKVKGATTGTQTGANGQYSIQVPGDNAVLVFSYIGFATQEVAVGGRNVINVELNTDATQLGEVVVTALGIERQRKEIGYATATVGNEALTQANPVNVVNGLQGKVSGLNVTSISSGVMDNDAVITMRGLRSLTGNNDPLLVLDGVPTQLSYLSSINPNDISNVSVLKGSSAAGIYGPDARNGVIIVTTKKGSETPVITFSNSSQLSRVSFFPKLQTQFGSGGYGEYIPYENWSWGPAYDGSTVNIGEQLPDGSQQTVTYSPTDQRRDFFNTGSTIQNDLSLSAKNFYLSFQDANVKGVVPDDENRRTGIRLNAGREYGKLRANLGINYVQNNYSLFDDQGMSDFFTAQGSGGNDGLMSQIFNTPAHIPLSNYKNFENDPFSTYNNYYNRYGINPYFALDNWRNEGKRQDILANIQLDFQAFDWLSFTYRPSLTARTIGERFFSRGEVVNQFGDDRDFNTIPGAVTERSYNLTRLSSDFLANLNSQITDDISIDGNLGTYVRQTSYRDSRVGASNLVVPEVFNVANRTGNLNGSAPESKTRLFSLYARAAISYKGWANVELTGRNDWTSVLSLDNNSFFYPGVSASFVATDAIAPLQESNILSYLKLRAAWNKTGNADIDPYQLAAVFTQPSNDGKFYTGFPYGPLAGYSAGNTTYDANLKPEFIESKEFGFESGFLNGRLNFEATYFHQNNTNQIINVRVSDATGFNFANLNAASFINKGVELDLRLTPILKFRNGDFQFRANATYNDSEITSIYTGLDELSIGGYLKSGNAAIVGQPAFVIKATDYLRDDQGRIIVDRFSGYPSEDANTKQFGRTLPLWIVGLNPSVNFKGFNLSALAEYKGGHNVSFYAMGGDMAWTGTSAATGRNNRERFVMPNSSYEDPNNPGQYIANTDVTVSNVNDFYTGVFQNVASNFITSAAAWRLRELTLSYDIPTKLLARQNIVKGVSLALTGRNLFLWVPKTNEFTDPDFNSVRSDYPNTFGIVNSQSNPPVRIYGANVVVRF